MGRLEGKVAVVTGGNSGIGKGTALLFCQEGAKVVIAARRAQNNREAIEEIAALTGGEISAVEADLTIPENCQKVVGYTIEKYGRIDILVNNAGIADRHKRIGLTTPEWYDEVVKIDQYAVYYMSKYALEHMEKVGKGAIVNVSSIGSGGVAGIAYSAAKAAVNYMTKNIAIQYAAATEIRCNAVAPGATPTPLNAPEMAKLFDMDFADITGRHLDREVPDSTVEDQAEAILFLASDKAKAITGQILYVDHGCSMY